MRPERLWYLLVASCGLGTAAVATAGAPVGSWFVSPELLAVLPDSHFRADDEIGFRFGLGRVLTEQWDAELAWAHNRFGAANANPSGELRFDVGELAVARVFQRSASINPFIEAGVGFETSHYDNARSATDPTARLGAGLLADVVRFGSSSLQLRADAGGRIDTAAGNGTRLDPYVGVGVRWNFGAPSPAAALIAPPPPAPPPPPPLAQAPAPPPPPAAPPVAPLDSDHDGVPDSLDRCPNTPPGDRVDSVGCSLTIRLQVYFDNDSAQIKPASDPDLDRLVHFLEQSPSATGVLEGHTDGNGKAAHNLGLSQRRAEAVKAYLVAHGIAAARLSTMGYGQTRPIADNGTADGRAQNRRVVFQRTDVPH
jgi:OOP family OmpA-OmpF porin